MCNNAICVYMAYKKHINWKNMEKQDCPALKSMHKSISKPEWMAEWLNGYHTAETCVQRPSFQTLYNIP